MSEEDEKNETVLAMKPHMEIPCFLFIEADTKSAQEKILFISVDPAAVFEVMRAHMKIMFEAIQLGNTRAYTVETCMLTPKQIEAHVNAIKDRQHAEALKVAHVLKVPKKQTLFLVPEPKLKQ